MSSVRLSGQSKLRTQDGEGLINRIGIECEDGTTRLRAGDPTSRATDRVIETDDPKVARVVRLWAKHLHDTAQIIAARNRPPLADPKPPKTEARRLPIDPTPGLYVACPACNGEGYFLCGVCDGEGRVTRQRAAEWRSS